MKHLKYFKHLNEDLSMDDIFSEMDELGLSNDDIQERPKEVTKPINNGITWDTCDGAKYFDKSSLNKYLGFDKPLYNIIEKRKFQELEFISPKQYIHNIAGGFGVSYEDALGGAYESNISDKYAKEMKNGSKFPVGYYNLDSGSQEGRHRAMACMSLGVKTMPIVKESELTISEVEEYVIKFKDYSKEDLNNYFKDVPNGITGLDWSELQRYIEYRL